jgi:TonB family protein
MTTQTIWLVGFFGLMSMATAGCVTPPRPMSQPATLPDCGAFLPAPASPSGQPPRSLSSGEPPTALTGFRLFDVSPDSPSKGFTVLDVTLDTSRLPKEETPPLLWDHPHMGPYYAEVKRRIEANWVYPQEARRSNQSGKGVVEFTILQDGRLSGPVKIVQSTGAEILDRYMVSAIRFSTPFPPVPCKLAEESVSVSLSFTYVLGRSSQ